MKFDIKNLEDFDGRRRRIQLKKKNEIPKSYFGSHRSENNSSSRVAFTARYE